MRSDLSATTDRVACLQHPGCSFVGASLAGCYRSRKSHTAKVSRGGITGKGRDHGPNRGRPFSFACGPTGHQMLTEARQLAVRPHRVLDPKVPLKPRPEVMWWAGLLAAACLVAAVPAASETFDGRRAVIIDGDTIALGSERVRILNIDAPESYRTHCERD